MRLLLKLGGDLLKPENREQLTWIAEDLARFHQQGHRLLLVHGGGPQTTELMRQMGREPEIVAGRRVTDPFALDVLMMAVGGRLNLELTSVLRGVGLAAVGLNGVSGSLVVCKKRPPVQVSSEGGRLVDYGRVGDVVSINTRLLDLLMADGYVPVLACIAGDENGLPYNINADNVANRLAETIKVDRLLLITGTSGVLKDVQDPNSRIDVLTVEEGRSAIKDGTVQGGMIPKLEESFLALEKGVGQILILGNLGPGDLRKALEQRGSVGTTLVKANSPSA